MRSATAAATEGFAAQLAAYTPVFNAHLDAALAAPQPSARLAAAMRHAVLAGGKRLRPYVLERVATLFGAAQDRSRPAALALELVHCYSLVHDDLPSMDNDALRRGQPTVHKAFDEATAILAGDALLTKAFEMVSGAPHLSAETRVQLVQELARAAGENGMVGGQMLDLAAEGRFETPRPAHERAFILELQARKTGALFVFACTAGALIGGGSEEDAAALARYGALLGHIFQLADDLLDVTSNAGHAGKATAKDGAAGKATLVGLTGIDDAHGQIKAWVDEAAGHLAPFGTRSKTLLEILHAAAWRKV